MTAHRSPLDAALDLVLYAPVGLALTLTEELPKLAAKGRSGLGGRVATARVVGQFAVAQGRQEVGRRLNGQAAAPSRTAPAPAARPGTAPAPSAPPAPGAAVRSTVPAPSAPPSTAPATARPATSAAGGSPAHPSRPVTRARAEGAVPEVGSLAIPGYDSLSASQVVQRLAGLSGPELEAVKEYEAAKRGRRTILARVGQLQGQ